MTEALPISGRLVNLRPHRAGDLPRIVEACSDSRTAYWLGTLPVPYTREHAQVFLDMCTEQIASGEALHWVIAARETDLLVGLISLMDLRSACGPEVGYWAHPDARARGYISAAVGLVVRHGFTSKDDGGLGFSKLRLDSATGNTASRQVATRNGFVEIGSARASIICRDGMHDAIRYALLVNDQ